MLDTHILDLLNQHRVADISRTAPVLWDRFLFLVNESFPLGLAFAEPLQQF